MNCKNIQFYFDYTVCSFNCICFAYCILLVLSCFLGALVFCFILWGKQTNKQMGKSFVFFFIVLSCVCVIFASLLFCLLCIIFFLWIIIWGLCSKMFCLFVFSLLFSFARRYMCVYLLPFLLFHFCFAFLKWSICKSVIIFL